MEDYNKIIESLGIRFVSVSRKSLIKSVQVKGMLELSNAIYLCKKGGISFGSDNERLNLGELLFIPANKAVDLTFGDTNGDVLTQEQYTNKIESYFDFNPSAGEEDMYCLNFEAKLFDAVSYFSSLDIPPFVISEDPNIVELIKLILDELETEKPGQERIIKNYTEQIVIHVIRYILDNQLFLEQLATNTTYFKDPRLIDIFKFIKDNLSGDLSNKVLANVANVSEDYVGQYFKMLTGINPQDYIEYQRMEAAVYLLRTTKKSIKEIGGEVGYKDTAYFCRRFKMMFGIPAGKLRRREKMS